MPGGGSDRQMELAPHWRDNHHKDGRHHCPPYVNYFPVETYIDSQETGLATSAWVEDAEKIIRSNVKCEVLENDGFPIAMPKYLVKLCCFYVHDLIGACMTIGSQFFHGLSDITEIHDGVDVSGLF